MHKPIGYWLKHLDGLIETAFDRAVSADGITRRHWQAMNAPEAASPEVMADLERRGWVAHRALTPQGESARAGLAHRIHDIRTALMDGLSEQDYLDTVRVLNRMADNLQRVSP